MAHSQPERGCTFWERELGSDDEPLNKQQMRDTWQWQHLKWPEPPLRGSRINRRAV